MNPRSGLLSLSLLLFFGAERSGGTPRPATYTIRETEERVRLGIASDPRQTHGLVPEGKQLFDDDDDETTYPEEGSGFGVSPNPLSPIVGSIKGSIADLYDLTGDLSSVLEDEVNGYNGEVFSVIDDFQSRMENATKSMAANLQCQFSERFQESIQIMEKIFTLSSDEMQQIKVQLVEAAFSNTTDDEPENVTDAPTDDEPESITDAPLMNLEPETPPRDCAEAYLSFTISGLVRIQPDRNSEPVEVLCDHDTDGGGWTVILWRKAEEPQLIFRRDWESYREGFGSPAGEHWIGLETMHQLTKRRPYKLRVDMEADGEVAYSLYDTFRVGPQWRKYRLKVDDYDENSTGGDALEYHNGQKFTTYDEDNDGATGGNCADWSGGGGWWYDFCYFTNPTALYSPPNNTEQSDEYMEWRKWNGFYNYLTDFRMMIRPQDFEAADDDD